MRYIELTEAPLADIEVHGQPLDQEGSFSAVDRNYMQHGIIAGIYQKSLAGLPFNLFIYVLNAADLKELGTRYPESEIDAAFVARMKRRGSETTLAPVLRAIEVNRKKDPSAVHFVIADNYSASGQIMPTAWIMVHRLLHAWFPGPKGPLVDQLTAIIDAANFPYNKFFQTFFTFKSSMTGNLLSQEVNTELATQFLLKGEIGLRNLDQLPPDQASKLQRSVKQYERYISRHMQKVAGKAFYI